MSVWFSGHAQAQSIQVSPVSIEMLPYQMATTLFVTNTGSMPSTLQLRPFRWDQTGSTDRLTATDDLMVSPPITNIAAGATQIFRLVLRAPAQVDEATYRLLLDQLPPPAMAGTVRIALRISIPVFAEPDTIVGPQLGWRINIEPNGAALIGVNQGSAHVRILNPVLTSIDGRQVILGAAQTPYILPGAERDWPIKMSTSNATPLQPGAILHLAATSDAGPVDASVHVYGP